MSDSPRFDYTTGFADYKRAQRTYIRSSLKRRLFFHWQMWGMAASGVCLLLWIKAFPDSAAPLHLLWPILLGGLLGGGVVLPLLRPWQARRVYSMFNGSPGSPVHAYLRFEDDILITGIVGKNEGHFRRASVCEFHEDEDTMILLFSKHQYLFLPKAALPPGALPRITEWLYLPGAPQAC